LEALGITIAAPLDVWRGTLEQFGIAFLFAPNHHPAMRFVGPVRKALGIRTVFNQLGPLANPARARRQVIGVYDDALLRPMAEAAHLLGIDRAWVVRGQDGLDEVSPCTPTRVAEVGPDGVRMRVVTPASFALPDVSPDALAPGETSEENAKILTEAISEVDSPRAGALLPSAAAALFVAGIADSLPDGAERAREAIRAGAAWELVETLKEVTRG
jgi:anthranilate phosphoribosyltransferase